MVQKGKHDIISNGTSGECNSLLYLHLLELREYNALFPKRLTDIIFHLPVHAVTNTGGLKRSGGQGDLLTGMIATSLAWVVAARRSNQAQGGSRGDDDDSEANHARFLVACYGACTFTRRCSQLAFEKHGRAVQSSDILDEIGPMFAGYIEQARASALWSEAICG